MDLIKLLPTGPMFSSSKQRPILMKSTDGQMGLVCLWWIRYYPLCRFYSVLHRLVSPSSMNNADDRKPLGEPAPQVSNLALAIVILVVITIQTVFVCPLAKPGGM